MKQQVSLESYTALQILANIAGSKREFAEIYSAATGLKSGYQTLMNTLRAKKGMNAKQASLFLHNLCHAEADSILQDYRDELQYAYYLLDYLMNIGAIERDDSMEVDAMTPFEERRLERQFGDGYEPTGNGNVEGLSDDGEEETTPEDVAEESEDDAGEHQGGTVSADEAGGEVVAMIRDKNGNLIVNPTEEEVEKFEENGEIVVDNEQESGNIDDVLAQLLSFSTTDKPAPQESKKSDDFLTNFLGKPTEVVLRPSVSSDGFDNDLANIPDVFDRESKKF